MLRESNLTVYTILIGPFLPRSNGGAVMDGLASATGGKSYFPGNAEKMSEAFEQVALELRRQYSIGYTPQPGFPRLVARSRKGYYALGHARQRRGSETAASSP
jgi:Ca-activated chloride channel family protein